MGSLANVLTSLTGTTDRLINNLATDSFFVMRPAKSGNGRGGTSKTYAATTVTALPCFYGLAEERGSKNEDNRATQRRPGVYYQFTVQSTVDIRATDRLRLVARGSVAQKDLEIVRIADPVGLSRQVLCFGENTPL